jgi:transcriptional regulator with PAS, ATPase and Fis domain
MAAAGASQPNDAGTHSDLPPDAVLFGKSQAMREVKERVQRLLDANIPVLLQGESGTGKELIAQLFHKYSPWSKGPFVKINCPAIPGTLLESELFGYEKGAFTGAYGAKPGKVELAHRGTLFLDEISEMSFDLQSKLLQLLQDGQFCRIGGQEGRHVEVRVICATNKNLQAEVAAGRFRQDLYYRIAVVTIQLPPLRERSDDIPGIVEFVIDRAREKFNTEVSPLSPHLLDRLQRHPWPGNIRELENLIRRYVIFRSERVISEELDKATQITDDDEIYEDFSLKKATRRAVAMVERKLILKVLENNNWNRKRSAASLGISYRALLYKIQQAGLPPARNRVAVEARLAVPEKSPQV